MEKIPIHESAADAILQKLTEILVPPINTIIKPSEVLEEAFKSYYALEGVLAKKIKDREAALLQAQKDLEQAKKEYELRTANPELFVSKTAEEIAIMKFNAVRSLLNTQARAFEDGASTVLKRAIKKAVSQ
jgi:hypothetical protein